MIAKARIAAQRFALPACGRAGKMFESRKNPKPEKCSSKPQTPKNPLHAVLGALAGRRLFANCIDQTLPPFLAETRKAFREPFEYFHQAKRPCQ